MDPFENRKAFTWKLTEFSRRESRRESMFRGSVTFCAPAISLVALVAMKENSYSLGKRQESETQISLFWNSTI